MAACLRRSLRSTVFHFHDCRQRTPQHTGVRLEYHHRPARRVTADAAGNVYFSSGNWVFKVSAGGTLALVAGNSRPGFSGDGGPAVSAQLNFPQGLALDSSGNLYIADSLNNRVRMVTPGGIINTFAGNGQLGTPRFLGDGGPANQANLQEPGGVAVDSSGNVYIADTLDNVIREVTTDGIINTIAGNFFAGYAGDTGAATLASFNHPQDVAVDSSKNIYIADTLNAYVRKITTDGNVNFIAGDGSIGYSGDGAAATLAGLIEPFSVAVDSSGNVYIDERADGRIRKIDSKGNISTIVGNGKLGFGGDGGSGASAQFYLPMGVAVDTSGNVYIADTQNCRVRKLASGGTVGTIAGNGGFSYSGDNGPATKAQLNAPEAVAVDSAGNFYIADTANHVVRKVAANGVISTLAGNGTAGFAGDGSAGAGAQLNSPAGVAVDSAGNVYIADTANSRIRKVAASGAIGTVAGSGTPGYGGDGGAASSAQLNNPVGVAVDGAGNLYIADTSNSAVRKVSTAGAITTVAGNGFRIWRRPRSGHRGAAERSAGRGRRFLGNLYIADTANNRIRMVATNGTITTLAGNGLAGYSGDGGPATLAQLASPTGVAVDAAGSVYVSDASAYVRKILFTGAIGTIAGNGSQGYSGDGGAASSAMLNRPTGLAADSKANVYAADTGNNAIRLLQYAGAAVAIAAVANGASNAAGNIAPGEVAVLYGSGLGPSQLVTYQLAGGLVPTTVGGTSVFFNGQVAPVLYSSATQVGVVVPFGISGSSAQITATYQGVPSARTTVSLAPAAPALFTLDSSGKGQAAVNNADSSINGSAHPASSGKTVVLRHRLRPVEHAQPGRTTRRQRRPAGAVRDRDDRRKDRHRDLCRRRPRRRERRRGKSTACIPTGLTAGNAAVVMQAGAVSTQSGVTVAVSGQQGRLAAGWQPHAA